MKTRRLISIMCAVVLLSSLFSSPIYLSAGAADQSFDVKVVTAENLPINGAHVSLWNHSVKPSVLLGQATTTTDGTVKVHYRNAEDEGETFQHMSVMVSAPGYKTNSLHWSPECKSMDGVGAESIYIHLESTAESSHKPNLAPSDSLSLPAQHPGEIRHRLVYYDYDGYRNRLTTVAIINQVGHMESSFTLKTRVETFIDVAAKGLGGNWQPSGSIKVSTSIGSALSWSLATTGMNDTYWVQTCKTQFDYCLEEYAIEEYQDTGDTWEWVQIDTQFKFYAGGLNADASPDGTVVQRSSPPSDTTWIGNLFTPNGAKVKETSEMDEISVGFTGTVGFATVTLSLRHVSAIRRAKNNAPTGGQSYEFGYGPDKSWRFRPT